MRKLDYRRKVAAVAFDYFCLANDTAPALMRNPSRHSSLVRKRQAIMWGMKQAQVGLEYIGKQLERHHSTVIHGARQHQERMEAANGAA